MLLDNSMKEYLPLLIMNRFCLNRLLFIIPLLLILSWSSSAQSDSVRFEKAYEIGKDLYYDGKYEAAQDSYLLALDLQRPFYGENHKEVAKTLFWLAKAYRRNKQYEKGLSVILEAQKIAEQFHADDYDLLGIIYNELGHIHDELYDPARSIYYAKKDLEFSILDSGDTTIEVAGAYMNMGMTYTDNGQYRVAVDHFSKAYAIFKKQLPPEHKNFNRIYLNLANLYRTQGDFDQCLEYGKEH